MDEDNEVIAESSSLMEDGNVTPTAPSEPAEPATPAEPTEPTEPVVPEPTLYELPDGRKVDAETLQKEWKDNFYPEFTRRSQELANLKKGNELPDNKPKSPYADPNYIPKSYEEIIEVAEQRALEKFEANEQARQAEYQAVEQEVTTQLADIKKLDTKLNENTLFEHANKYGFRDLKLAWQNMKDMSDVVKKTQTATAQNIAKRNDPVSVTHGAGGQKLNPDDFATPRDYLRALKGQ